MAEFLENLLPKSGIVRWFPLNETVANGQNVTSVLDKSANAAHLTSQATYPLWQTNVLNGRNVVYFDELKQPLKNITPFTAKHIFIVTKTDSGATFGAYRGLLTGLDVSNYGVLVGNTDTSTKFVDNNFEAAGTYVYKKSQTAYAENNLEAPFDNFELIDVSLSVGWALDGVQTGQDRDDDARRWIGRVAEILIYDRVLTAAETKQVNLYFDLKFGLWRLNNTVLNFPSPDLTNLSYSRFWADNPDYKAVTVSHEYEDAGKDFIEISDNAPRRWRVEINCHDYNHAASKAKTDIFDAFYNQARFARTFNFTDKYGETHSGVRIADYNRAHSGHQSWSQNVEFELVKYP